MIGARAKFAWLARGTLLGLTFAAQVVWSDEPVRPLPVPESAGPLVSACSSHPLPTVTPPANTQSGGQCLLAPFWPQAKVDEQKPLGITYGSSVSIPPDFAAWWEARTVRPSHPSSLLVDIDSLLQNALVYSPFVRSVAAEPYIRDTVLAEESAAFDWETFFESAYDDFNDPVGNELTTGNNDSRFRDKNWRADGGIRRMNPLGGQIDLGQRLGAQKNNSRFLLPNPQGTARLELNYTHPILNGGGRAYNRSQIVLAQLDSDTSRDELVSDLQDHLLQVTIAYWDLYRARTRFLQRVMLLESALQIRTKLEGREQVDALYRQILRARSAVTNRESEIGRAAAEIDNAEAQLRALVNDPTLVQTAELIPLVKPFRSPVNVSMRDSLTTALTHRRDISQSIRAISAASVQLGVAKRDLLPRLDLLMSSYVAGLQDDASVFQAWSNQFSQGRPGFSVGFLWELPKGNRVAKARERRRILEIQRASSEFESTVNMSLTEVEIAVREVATTYSEMLGRYQAMLAARNETAYLMDRYELLPDVNDSAPLLLEDLLDAQERQADEEAAFVDAEVNYSISLIGLRKAMGTLLVADLGSCGPLQIDTGGASMAMDVENFEQPRPGQPSSIPSVEFPADGDGGRQPEFLVPPPAKTQPLPVFPLDLPQTNNPLRTGTTVDELPAPDAEQAVTIAGHRTREYPTVDADKVEW